MGITNGSGGLRGAVKRLFSVPEVLDYRDQELSATVRLGLWGEEQAAGYLEDRGFKMLDRRWRSGHDELDMVCAVGSGRRRQLVFVEVKTRRSADFGGPLAALNRRKRHALCRAAARYLRRYPAPPPPFRFDVVGVIGHFDRPDPPVIQHLENAFPMESRYITPWLGKRRA